MKQIEFDNYLFDLENLQKIIKKYCNYKILKKDNELTVINKRKEFKIKLFYKSKYTCFKDDEIYWFSISFFDSQKLCGHGYGTTKQYLNEELIERELRFLEYEITR